MINISQTLKTLGELRGIVEVLKPENGELRWQLLQSWLQKNPTYHQLLLECLSLSPDQAVVFLCEKLDLDLQGLSLLDPSGSIRSKIEAAIGQLQELYKDKASLKSLPQ